jgi:4a-hydroxytetrahydrobiopterin dehydratase
MTAVREQLTAKHCQACEGGVPKLSSEEVAHYLAALPGWALTHSSERIAREWDMKDFAAALRFFADVGRVAEEEGHHPDLHLTGYRHVTIEIYTHAVGGLTENDFILAAKIDRLPAPVKR